MPSTVDVFVNGQPVSSEQVQPGPFEINGIPAVNGAGQMQVVVTDALGRQQVVSQPFYAGTSLLRQGLSEYSVEAGAVRRNYANRSNDYGNAVGAATYRRGMTDSLTAGAHAEAQSQGAAAAGVDGAVQVGTLGIVSGSAAVGGDGSGTGWLGGLGFERNGPRVSLYGRGLYASQGFSQLGDSALEVRPRLRAFGGLGLNLLPYGSLQFAYGLQTNWTSPSVETFGLGYSLGLGTLGYLNLFASHTSADGYDQRRLPYLDDAARRATHGQRIDAAQLRTRARATSSKPSPRCSRIFRSEPARATSPRCRAATGPTSATPTRARPAPSRRTMRGPTARTA